MKNPSLGIVVDEFYWNIYAQGARMDLSNAMEMGGLSQPTPADFLYRLIPALQILVTIRPEQLDNRFRLGVAYRWNNDQVPMVETFEALVKDIPDNRKTPKAEACFSWPGLGSTKSLGIEFCMILRHREPMPMPRPPWRMPNFLSTNFWPNIPWPIA